MSRPAQPAAAGSIPNGARSEADDSITGAENRGHGTGMEAREPEQASARSTNAEPAELSLAAVYEAHFDFVWRSARRLGVSPLHLDDVVQEVFLVVHRKLAEFEGRAPLKSWLYGITRRVARDHRRGLQRRPTQPLGADEPADRGTRAPDEQLALREQGQLLHALLAELDEDKREAFVLAELEQMSGPEIAAALQINLNTAYARVRAARIAFEAALERLSARERRAAP
jgi:RNA polymerase sigma-70 factor (ECF subfamily)